MNTAKGRNFQNKATELLSAYYGVKFKTESPKMIGSPPKEHKFDLVSEDDKYIGECKNYSWTETGNVPSAKMAFLNEAVFYLQHLTGDCKRFIAMRYDVHEKRRESFAEYYFRTNRHLLNGVYIIEIDLSDSNIKEIGR